MALPSTRLAGPEGHELAVDADGVLAVDLVPSVPLEPRPREVGLHRQVVDDDGPEWEPFGQADHLQTGHAGELAEDLQVGALLGGAQLAPWQGK